MKRVRDPIQILYLSYDGMMEPLGESQVLGYLSRISQDPDFKIHLISFEKPEDLHNEKNFSRMKQLMQKYGIEWHPQRYHKKFTVVATAYDIFVCTLVALKVHFKNRISIVHARSYVPSITALFFKHVLRVQFIFDMRGFWADERADAGQWPHTSMIYRLAKWFEKQFLLNADAVVSLTHLAVSEMKTFPYLIQKKLKKGWNQRFFVIPTCAKLDEFQPSSENKTRLDEEFLLGHVGSIGSWYLFRDEVRFFKQLKKFKPRAKFLVFNRNEHDYIRQVFKEEGIAEKDYEVKSLRHDEVRNEILRLDASVFFIKPLYSKKASAPTKLAELLACGIPCVVNSGIGDMDLFFNEKPIGVALRQLDDENFKNGVEKLFSVTQQPTIQTNCRNIAERYFSVDSGVAAYKSIYRQI